MATAFAVYSADDNSLNFYKRDTVPTAGDSFDGKTATAVYTGIETDAYTASTQPWQSYASSIASVIFVDSGITPVSTAYWFSQMSNASLTTIGGLDKLDTTSVTSMNNMFDCCKALTSLNLSGFDTSKVTNMNRMFRYCSALTSLNLSGWNTSKVENMGRMFSHCSALTSLDVSSFNTSNVTDMDYMFSYCSALTSLNLSRWNTSKVTDMSYMFYDCTALDAIYVSDKWSTASVTSSRGMFYNCSALPNFNSSMLDKTNAHYNTGGYLTYEPPVLYLINKRTLVDIANAIRAKTGGTTSLTLDDMVVAINNI